MKPHTLTVTASASGNAHSAIFVPCRHISPFNISFGAVPATCKFTIQHTFDDPLQTTSLTWFSHEFVVAASANIDGNYAFPVGGIRVEASAAVSADDLGSVTVTFIQAGIVA